MTRARRSPSPLDAFEICVGHLARPAATLETCYPTLIDQFLDLAWIFELLPNSESEAIHGTFLKLGASLAEQLCGHRRGKELLRRYAEEGPSVRISALGDDPLGDVDGADHEFLVALVTNLRLRWALLTLHRGPIREVSQCKVWPDAAEAIELIEGFHCLASGDSPAQARRAIRRMARTLINPV